MPTRAEFEEEKHKRSAQGTFAEKPAVAKARLDLVKPQPAKPGTITTTNTPGKTLQEDDVPAKSPTGAKLVDFKGGVGTYSDGSKFNVGGWQPAPAPSQEQEYLEIERQQAAETTDRLKAMPAAREAARRRSHEMNRKLAEQARREAIALRAKYEPILAKNSLEQNLVLARKLGWFVGKDKEGRPYIRAPWGARFRGSKAKPVKKARKAKKAVKKVAKKKKKPQGFWHGFTSSADQGAQLRARVHGITAAIDWDESLHPRGRDGKFIDVGGFVSGIFRWFGGKDNATGKPAAATYAKVQGFYERSDGGVDVAVMEPGRPGQVGVANTATVTQVAGPKARLGDEDVTGRDGKPISVGQKVELAGMHGFQHGQRGKYEVEGEVVEIIDGPDATVVRVKVTDPRWEPAKFGETFDAQPKQVAAIGYKGTSKPTSTPKGDGKTATPKPPSIAKNDTGEAPARTYLTGYKPSPDGPGFLPLETSKEWFAMTPAKRLAWLKEQMEADFGKWRGEPVVIDFTGYDSGIALNLANTYRELANWDPDTARRIDKFIPGHMDTDEGGLGHSAIAVAHPGTAHPGGIGPKIKESAIVLKESYFANMGKWHKHHGGGMPWSMSEFSGDPTLTLVHEFAHQRQFRFFAISMSEVDKAWSPVVMEDGFGMIPDSSKWPITQELRYKIPNLTPTKYGHSKTSEGFAEAWAARATGDASPELIEVLDEWDTYMGLTLVLPKDRYSVTSHYDTLSQDEQDKFWQEAGPMLSLPGMREHYPESAAVYDQWASAVQPPQPAWIDPKGEIGYTENDDDWSDVLGESALGESA